MKNKEKIIYIIILTFIYITILFLITKNGFALASVTDYLKQHTVFPDYFRNLFYETKLITPNFAPHLGGGQNIFYFIYYGYLNPIILLSYFLPFISMKNYILFSTIILNYMSILLIYKFLKINNYKDKTAFISTLFFMLSSPLIFHLKRHIMFINYLPFLILALINVNTYLNKNKSLYLIISIVLMIFTNFYFSIAGIITISLYALFKISEKNKDIFKSYLKFIFRIFIAIFLSAIILLPTLYVIFNGRASENFNLFINLIPKIDINFISYNAYGLGLTSIILISLAFNMVNTKKSYKFLSICLAIIISIPLINMLLNGGLYLNGKAFIPFLPLFILLISEMLENQNMINYKFILILIIFLILIKKEEIFIIFSLDLLTSILFIYLYKKYHKISFLVPILIFSFILCLTVNKNDVLVSKEKYDEINLESHYPYQEYLDNNNRFDIFMNQDYFINYSKGLNDYRTSLYSSTSNKYYQDIYYNVFNNNDLYRNKFMLSENNNLFFESFMGVKYILSNKTMPYGYQKIKEFDKGSLYENKNVNNIGFATQNVISESHYNDLSFNEQLEVFGKNIITENSDNYKSNFISKKIDLDYEISNVNNLEYQKNEDNIKIKANDNASLKLHLNNSLKDILIIRFKVKSNKKDLRITINGVSNKLTASSWKYYNSNEIFDYVISDNQDINDLNISFSNGDYEIEKLETYLIPKSYFDSYNDDKDFLNIEEFNDILNGSINVSNDGYFIFTIPFDKGFEVYVDNENIPFEKVNMGFIGFKIKKGPHKIKLVFSAPLFKEGKIVSLIGLGLLMLLVIYEEKRDMS